MVHQLKPCGTPAAYQRHLVHRTPPCRPCKDAINVVKRGQQRRRRPLANTTPRIIADHLETFGVMPIRELAYLIQHRHTVEYETIRRSVHRMIGDGRLQSVKDWQGRLRVSV